MMVGAGSKFHPPFIILSSRGISFGLVSSSIIHHPLQERKPISRRNILKLLAGAGVAGGGCLVNAFAIEPGILSITRERISCAKLPPALDGLRVAVLGDFHFRPGVDDDLLEKVVRAVNAEKVDIVALTGDFITGDSGVVEPLLGGLRRLEAAHGVFAVMGNHDGWAGSRDKIRNQFEKAGISFFINHNSILKIRGESLAVAGTDYVWLGKPDPVATLRGVHKDTPVVALVHEPDYFDKLTRHREILLQVSGHTHGGQCRVPLVGYAPVKVRYGEKYVYGSFESGDSRLFVTRGVGTMGPRVRFACPPELAILTLQAPLPA